MSEEKDKDKKEDKKPTDATATTPTTVPTTTPEGEKKQTLEIIHKFVREKPPETPAPAPVETPKATEGGEKPTEVEKPAEKPAEKGESVEELKKKLDDVTKSKEEVDAILAALALKEFETDREALAKRVTDPKKKAEIEQIDDPDKLKEATFEINKSEFLAPVKDETKRKELMDMIKEPEDLQRAKIMEVMMRSAYEQYGGGVKPAEGSETKPEDEGTEKVPPSTPVVGKAPEKMMPNATKDYINGLYDVLADPTKSQKEKDIANSEINALWNEFRRAAKELGIRDKYIIPPIMECPKCHSLIVGKDSCDVCGWSASKFEQKLPFEKTGKR